MPQPNITLYHHAGERGQAEKIRLFLAESGLKYTGVDCDAATFESMKADGTLMFGSLPACQVGGDEAPFLEGGTTILSALAGVADSQGKGQGGNQYQGLDAEKDYIRTICEAATLFEAKMEIASGSGGEVTPVLEEYFGYFQNCLKANDGEDARTVDWMHGQQLTYADIAVFGAVNYAVTIHKANMTLRGFGGLKEFHDKCAERTRMAMHLTGRAAAAK